METGDTAHFALYPRNFKQSASAPVSVYIDDLTIVRNEAADPVAALPVETAVAENPVELLPGASLRLKDPSGLRFESTLSREGYELLTDTYDEVEFGTCIFPADRYAEYAAKGMEGALKSTFSDVEDLTGGEESYTFYSSVVNLMGQNYARTFGAVSYITVTLGDVSRTVTTAYDPAANSRSIYQVAKAVLSDTDGEGMTEYRMLNAQQQAVVTGYLDAVVEIENNAVVVIPDYTSPYIVSVADGVLTVTAAGETDVNNIRCVIYLDRVYTGGWSVQDGVFTAELPGS